MRHHKWVTYMYVQGWQGRHRVAGSGTTGGRGCPPEKNKDFSANRPRFSTLQPLDNPTPAPKTYFSWIFGIFCTS